MQITDSGSQVTGYKIQLDEVLKGSAELQSLTFISSSAGTSCEYHHSESDYNVEYLVTAYNNSGDVSVSGCNYVVPWNELSSNQILGIQGAYSEGCTRNCGTICPFSAKMINQLQSFCKSSPAFLRPAHRYRTHV
ncbi:hypothetical protein NDU88_000964 [Pleurodeles waltl]|uniref:NTR domain-containing protein n=1 Tax=Pleurodeles waltl TaxID=8319 RepID=A0AAV7LXV5_PLEWA|nr:hypothetical protein NDU88_000964 [Pleurodeles waltl]